MIHNTSHADAHANLLIDLDCILDTRHGTLAKFGVEALTKALTHGYFTRNSDHFYGIDPEKYFQLYRERDAVTLSMSVMSHGVSIIKDFVTRVHLVSATSPVQKVPRVEVNLYPYDPPQRVIDNLKKALTVLIDDKVDIAFVRYSPEDLHYDIVKHTYDHLCMYDIGPWLNAQGVDWEKRGRGLPDVTVFTPMLVRCEDPKDVPEDITPVIDELSAALSPVLNVMFMPTHFFCTVANPFDLTKETPPQSPKAPEQEGQSN